jgi:hypothetical protein
MVEHAKVCIEALILVPVSLLSKSPFWVVGRAEFLSPTEASGCGVFERNGGDT